MARKTAEDTIDGLLDRGWDEIVEPKTLPAGGTWLLNFRNVSYQPARGDGSPSFLFVYGVDSPLDDVSEDDLAELGEGYDFGMNRIFYRAWVQDARDLANVRNHIMKHGSGLDLAGINIKEGKALSKALRGTQVYATLGVREYENNAGEMVTDNEPSQFAPVTE